jgi:transketolase
MLAITEQNISSWSKESFRTMLMKSVCDIASDTPELIFLVADLGRAIGASEFCKSYPDRYIEVGIAEQNMMGIAAGLASCGKMPIVTTFAPFASMRCCEQIRTDVAYTNYNVKVVGFETGLSQGTLGTTHYGLEDIGVLRSIANLAIMSPADATETVKMMKAATAHRGPVYIRLNGGRGGIPMAYKSDYDFEIGRGVLMEDGSDGTIIAVGSMVPRALHAADIMRESSVHFRVVNMHTIKPIDEDIIVKAAKETKNIVTVEEHTVTGGLGSAVADVLAQHGVGQLTKAGLPDAFPDTVAPYEDLLDRYGLTAQKLAKKALRACGKG